MVRKSSMVACFMGWAVAGCSAADYSFFFTISNDVSPAQPDTTVTLWAAFPKKLYAFAQSFTEVRGASDPGGFSDPKVLIYQHAICYPGDVSPDGDSILNIGLQQVQALGGLYADASNPIELWSVTWSTDDFTPRNVSIATQSSSFYVYLTSGGDWENFYGPDFAEAEDFIRVVPSPSALALLAGFGVWVGRRRA